MSTIPAQADFDLAFSVCRDAGQKLVAAAVKQAEACREPRERILLATKGQFFSSPVGYYWHPKEKVAAISGHLDLPLAQAKRCIDRVAAVCDLSDKDPTADPAWVKVAYSPMLRRVGELLNFFPGNYTAGIPNVASPVASMLTTGLLGGGLGYGAGWLGEQLMPKRWKRGKLRKTLALLGAGLGAAPGLLWMGLNKSMGKGFNDPSLLSGPRPVNFYPRKPGERFPSPPPVLDRPETPSVPHLMNLDGKLLTAADAFEAGEEAIWKEAAAGGSGSHLDVNINSLGQTLWEAGASPQEAAVTVGSMLAAEKMPGGDKPGWVTPAQVGHLAMGLGGGYLTGALVGATLGALTGLPEQEQSALRRTGAVLGVVNTVIPALFSRD